MISLADRLALSPALFPQALDLPAATVKFVRLRRDDYEAASFLDDRILNAQSDVSVASWTEVTAAVDSRRLPERHHFIFHIGHVGSTLLSRLIGAHPDSFALREPLLLRAFAQLRESGALSNRADAPSSAWTEVQFAARLGTSLQLLSRTFESTQTAVIKATSVVSELAPELMARAAAPKAVLVHVAPESYLATILGGPNSRKEAKLLTPLRARRLQRAMGTTELGPVAALSEGETLALAWICETAALARAAHAAPGRTLRVDFNHFLLAPHSCLQAMFQHLDIPATAHEVDTILAGPIMTRYSKAPEYAYDTSLRSDVLNEARHLHGHEIRRGLVWLDTLAERCPALREAMAFAGGAAS